MTVRDTHVASSVVDVLRVATDGGARELLRVVLGEAPGAAGGCAIVGAVDGARAANLFGEVEDDSSWRSRARATIVAKKNQKVPSVRGEIFNCLRLDFDPANYALRRLFRQKRPQIGPEPTRGPVCRTQLRRGGRAPSPRSSGGP